MSIYSTKCQLTSCKVNLELIRNIEKFILARGNEYLLKLENGKNEAVNEAAAKEMYHLYIQNKNESIKYSSIEEYKEEKFADGTNSVILEFTSMVEKFFHLKVTFDSSISGHPVLELAMVDRNAREICKSIEESITKIVKGHRNINFLFHNRFVQIGLLLFYTVYNVWNYFMLFSPSDSYTDPLSLAYFIIFSFAFVVFILWYIVSIFLCRFTTFDTNRQKIINISYYVITVISFLIIAYYLYRIFSHIHP
jgi:hypothetical protein